jgi:hypothetical protein
MNGKIDHPKRRLMIFHGSDRRENNLQVKDLNIPSTLKGIKKPAEAGSPGLIPCSMLRKYSQHLRKRLKSSLLVLC